MTISLCQMAVGDNKIENVRNAEEMIKNAKSEGAQLVVLPEMFCCPYDNSKFYEYSESVDNGYAINSIKECAVKYSVYISAGSIPERADNKLYNTQCLIADDGTIKAAHRKTHLFDIDVKGKITFKESDILSPGEQITITDIKGIKLGLAICYDIRFPEYFRILAINGVKLVILPAAFNMTTGPAHWETVLRCRALDNQLFIAAVSPARNYNASYVAYGHSMVTGPWGDIKIQAGENQCIKTVEIDFSEREVITGQLPLLKHLRKDLYETVYKKGVDLLID